MATVAHLLRLPPELMLRISASLTTDELGKFRLACKQVETNLFESFAREFFSKRQFMVEKVSLEALVGIANHKTLAPYLTEVIIGLDTLHYENSPRYGGQYNISRSVFLETGLARDMLVEAFSKLPNLRSVGLRDYEGNGRFRDGETAKWKSYGWSLAHEYPHVTTNRNLAPPDTMLPLLLFALKEASVTPTNLEAFLRRSRMPDCSFDLSCLPADVSPVLSGLETILLSLDESRRGVLSGHQLHRHLKEFLQHTTRLAHLRLNFIPMNDVRGAEYFLDWLGTPFGATSKPDEPPAIAPNHLTTLDLGMLSVTPAILLRVVSKFANLKSFSLWKVTLPCSPHEQADDFRVWPKFLPKLGRAFQAPDNVDFVMIGFAAITPFNSEELLPVQFASKTSIDQNGEKKYEDAEGKVFYRKCVGSNVQEWFDELGEKAFVEDLGRLITSDFNDESDEDDEEEEDEGIDTQAEDSDGSE